MVVAQTIATAFETADRALIRAGREIAGPRGVCIFRHRVENGAHMAGIILPVGREVEIPCWAQAARDQRRETGL